MKMITVKPAEGLKVRKPDSQHLSHEGETVPRNAFWVRRLNEGDVELVPAESKPAKKEAK